MQFFNISWIEFACSSLFFALKKSERVTSCNYRPDRAVTVESRRLRTPAASRREWFKCSQISVRGIIEHPRAFKINLAETKRDRSISIGTDEFEQTQCTQRKTHGREIEMDTNSDGGVGVGRPTGSRFLNFRVINLIRHRQHRSVRASGTTIVLIQISPIRSLTLALTISLFLSLFLFFHPALDFSPEGDDDALLVPLTTRPRHVKWTFNRFVIYCNRFVASRNHAFHFKSHYARRMYS